MGRIHPLSGNKHRYRGCKIRGGVILVILLLMLASVGHTYTTLANYNFYGLSPGTTSVSCTIDPGSNQDWIFDSK